MTTAQPIPGLLRKEQAVATRDDRSIGAILIDSGKLTPEDAEQVLRLQKEQGLRFGEAAIKLGLVTEDAIRFALSHQFDYSYLMPGESKVSQELVAAYNPFSPQVEALRALRSQLMLRWFTGEPKRKALAIVSLERGEGRSYLAANLAIVFSQLGEHTLLFDADMRNPRQHQLFNLANRVGLSSILAGRGESGGVERIPAFQDLSVLAAGAVPPNPQELLGRPIFAKLLEELSGEFDVIIVDTPACGDNADAQTIAVRSGAALLLARSNHTQAMRLQDSVQRLRQASAEIVGTVLTVF